VEQGGHIFEQIAVVFLLVTAVRLLHRAVRGGGVQERWFGFAIGAVGISYLFYQIPYYVEFETAWSYYYFAGRVTYCLAVLSVAVTTRRIFESDRAWATGMVWLSALLMVAGLAISLWNGSPGGTAPLSDLGFWLEWLGQIAPFAWLTAEALVQWGKLKQGERLGFSPPGVAHRFLFIGLFAVATLSGSFVQVPMYVEIETQSRTSVILDFLMSLAEIAGAVALWVAFFPPRFLRSRIERSASTHGAGI
jgi:hypothetical protein